MYDYNDYVKYLINCGNGGRGIIGNVLDSYLSILADRRRSLNVEFMLRITGFNTADVTGLTDGELTAVYKALGDYRELLNGGDVNKLIEFADEHRLDAFMLPAPASVDSMRTYLKRYMEFRFSKKCTPPPAVSTVA